MAINKQIGLVVFDIGGVVAEISKAPICHLLASAHVREQDFFDVDFAALQAGQQNPQDFLANKSSTYGIDPAKLASVFTQMIDTRIAAQYLPLMRVPYLFCSNINSLHFAKLNRAVKLSPFTIANSVLSYQVGYLKPHALIFDVLKQTIRPTKKATLYVDDKLDNLIEAKRIGCHTLHCLSPQKLGKLLTIHGLI